MTESPGLGEESFYQIATVILPGDTARTAAAVASRCDSDACVSAALHPDSRQIEHHRTWNQHQPASGENKGEKSIDGNHGHIPNVPHAKSVKCGTRLRVPGQSNLRSRAIVTAWALSRASSFPNACCRCVFTVVSEMPSWMPIAPLARPSVTNRSRCDSTEGRAAIRAACSDRLRPLSVRAWTCRELWYARRRRGHPAGRPT